MGRVCGHFRCGVRRVRALYSRTHANYERSLERTNDLFAPFRPLQLPAPLSSPPEMLAKETHSYPADWYSYGATLYTLIRGVDPLHPEITGEVRRARARGELERARARENES